jgi:hypothetical protein
MSFSKRDREKYIARLLSFDINKVGVGETVTINSLPKFEHIPQWLYSITTVPETVEECNYYIELLSEQLESIQLSIDPDFIDAHFQDEYFDVEEFKTKAIKAFKVKRTQLFLYKSWLNMQRKMGVDNKQLEVTYNKALLNEIKELKQALHHVRHLIQENQTIQKTLLTRQEILARDVAYFIDEPEFFDTKIRNFLSYAITARLLRGKQLDPKLLDLCNSYSVKVENLVKETESLFEFNYNASYDND